MVHLYLTFFFYMHATDAHGHIQCACTCSKSSVKVWYWNHVQRYHSHNAGGLLENENKNWSLETRLQTLHTLEHSNAVNYFYFFYYFLHVHHKDTKQHISEINFACLITSAVLHFFRFRSSPQEQFIDNSVFVGDSPNIGSPSVVAKFAGWGRSVPLEFAYVKYE